MNTVTSVEVTELRKDSRLSRVLSTQDALKDVLN